MQFRYAYLTRQGNRIHTVALGDKAVKLFDNEQEARDEADRLNQEERSLKTPSEKAEWFRRWTDAPDKRNEAYAMRREGREPPPGDENPEPGIREGCVTPWGEAHSVMHLGAGVHMTQTESHGGLFIPSRILKEMPQAVKDCLHQVRTTGQYAGNWAEEDCDLAVVMPFIFSRLNPELLERCFGQEAREILWWTGHAERICRTYPEEYGKALAPLQELLQHGRNTA